MSEENKDIQTITQKDETSSYRSIFKATSLFGGVQVYQILVRIVKSKFVAVLLGPEGMGIQGLYQSAIHTVQSITSLGLAQSAVRDVSEANSTGDASRIGHTVAVFRRLVWLTGLLGMMATILLSPLFSKTSFGSYDYIIPFIVLSVILLTDQICVGQKVLLQGTRKLKSLAKASAIGATVGLFVSVPLFYFLGTKGIIPSLIFYSVIALLLSWFYSKKVRIVKVKVSLKEALSGGRNMMKMGLAMSLNAILATSIAYVLRVFIRYTGGVEEVGLYVAGFTIMNTYVGMVFSAMSTDYYPRLSAVNNDNNKCRELINHQGEVAVLILAPIIISCIILMPFLIRLIYSEKFLLANDFISWSILAMMFKAGAWSISYVFLAKAEAKLFIINETIANVYNLLLNFAGYYICGLTGLGIAFLITQFLYFCQVFIVSKKRYGFSFTYSFKEVFYFQLGLVLVSFILIHSWQSKWVYLPLIILFAVCSIYSIIEFNKRMDFFDTLRKRILK